MEIGRTCGWKSIADIVHTYVKSISILDIINTLTSVSVSKIGIQIIIEIVILITADPSYSVLVRSIQGFTTENNIEVGRVRYSKIKQCTVFTIFSVQYNYCLQVAFHIGTYCELSLFNHRLINRWFNIFQNGLCLFWKNATSKMPPTLFAYLFTIHF